MCLSLRYKHDVDRLLDLVDPKEPYFEVSRLAMDVNDHVLAMMPDLLITKSCVVAKDCLCPWMALHAGERYSCLTTGPS